MKNKLLPLGLFILAAGISYFYIYPTYTNTIAPAQQQITTYDTALAAATQFTQNEKNLLTQSQAISPTDLGRLQWYMPDSIDQIHFIDGLNHLGNSYGVALSGFTISQGAGNVSVASSTNASSSQPSAQVPVAAPAPQASASPSSGQTPLKTAGSTNSLDLNISATATYDAFQSFMLALEQSAPLFDVTHLSIVATNTGVYTYSMEVRSYWLP